MDIMLFIHEEGVVHRDIKPENFCVGKDEHNFDKLYILDFGLSKIFYSEDTGHIAPREGKSLLGDMMYASIANHEGKEQSRRDDLESILYMVIHLMAGSLPWTSVVVNKNMSSAIKSKKILQMKAHFLDSDFWSKSHVKLKHAQVFNPSVNHPVNSVKIPYEFNLILGDIISLDFEEKPDYYTYKKLLKTMSLDYKLISTRIVENFRDEFKPRDHHITETFNWPNGALNDWNLTSTYLDCLTVRKNITILLD
jgi:serine/threonine protein kinase